MYWRIKIRDGNPEYGRLCTCIGESKSGMGTLSMGGCVHVLEKQKIRDGNPEYERLCTCIGESKLGMGTLSMGWEP